MESSKIFGGTEECHSSESGWTMYIGSPIQGGDDDGDDGESTEEEGDVYAGNNNGGRGNETDVNHEAADSDDSMASDASSGPSHQGHLCGNMEVGVRHGTSCFKHGDEDEEEGDCYLDDEKAKKPMEKQKLGMKKKGEKEQMTFNAKAATTSRSGSKVRKSIWLGKRN